MKFLCGWWHGSYDPKDGAPQADKVTERRDWGHCEESGQTPVGLRVAGVLARKRGEILTGRDPGFLHHPPSLPRVTDISTRIRLPWPQGEDHDLLPPQCLPHIHHPFMEHLLYAPPCGHSS